jgi:hypothetical protein
MRSAPLALATIQRSIRNLRGQRVMLDADLARMYGVETGALNRAVKRNLSQFPDDFMFRLDAAEATALTCQAGISNPRGGRRHLPYAFTEQGVAMLSSVLNSPRAIAVNIEIMRAFVQMRRVLLANADLAKRLALLESELAKQSAEFGHHKAETVRALKVVFEALKSLSAPPPAREPRRKPVGFDLR